MLKMLNQELKWLTIVDDNGLPLGEFNMDSPRVRAYVISTLLPSFVRRRLHITIMWSKDTLVSYPYHYGFAGDIFDSIHISKEMSCMRIMRQEKGLQYIEPQYVLQ